ncbi:antitoxin [Janibacter terrae]|uniref:antitoxin n=1 Tax=Janibacter terrae TaxID=103817 RepID=UPI0037FC18C6
MAKFKNAAAMLTALEAARQWARSNPDKAGTYIDRAAGFVDGRTKGRYHKQVEGFSRTAKKNLTGSQTVTGSTVHGSSGNGATPPPPQDKRFFPDGRA